MNYGVATYKKIIGALSLVIAILLISNYSALRKLDMVTRIAVEDIETIEEPVFTQPAPDIIQDATKAIVLVIDDFGYRNDSVSDRFLNLPIPLTCAVLPGHSQSASIAKKALKSGKEVIIHMPMESSVSMTGEDEFKLK
jgi:Uncharacterized protein conserved in bacteria